MNIDEGIIEMQRSADGRIVGFSIWQMQSESPDELQRGVKKKKKKRRNNKNGERERKRDNIV